MIDFSGWAANWEWSGYSHGDSPRWFEVVLVIPAIVGAVCVVLSFSGVQEESLLWLLGALLGAGLIEFFTRFDFDQKRHVVVSYAFSTVFAGLNALVALRMSDAAVSREFAVIAPCLVFGFGPITSRALAATFFSFEMVDYAKERTEQVRAALAGEVDALIARAENIEGEDVVFAVVGEATGQTLVASRKVFGRTHFPAIGAHLLFEAPSLGDVEASGYRGDTARRRVVAMKTSHYLGRKPESLSASMYWDEVRAGIVFLLLEHSILFGIAWVLARVFR